MLGDNDLDPENERLVHEALKRLMAGRTTLLSAHRLENPYQRSRIMAWVYLVIAGLFEIGWAVGLKYTEGFTTLWPSVLTILAMLVSFSCLAQAVRTIPVGTGYAIWTGIGAVGTALLGIMLFAEAATLARLACVGLIVAGIVGLKLTTP